jgi:hypothetical protein
MGVDEALEIRDATITILAIPNVNDTAMMSNSDRATILAERNVPRRHCGVQTRL